MAVAVAIKVIAIRFGAITVFEDSQVGTALNFFEVFVIGGFLNFYIVGIAFLSGF